LPGRVLAGLLLSANVSAAAAQAPEQRWALSSAACTGELFTRREAPLILVPHAIRWFDFDCSVVSSYKVGQALFLQGQCTAGGRASTIPIMLEPKGDRLRVGWNREAIVDMRLCHWTAAFGYHWDMPEAVLQGPDTGAPR
jgi:hypothetical protein